MPSNARNQESNTWRRFKCRSTSRPESQVRVQEKRGVVSPGFEPRQRESKSLVLPLHHETTQLPPARQAAVGFYHNCIVLASSKCVLEEKNVLFCVVSSVEQAYFFGRIAFALTGSAEDEVMGGGSGIQQATNGIRPGIECGTAQGG